MDTNFIEKNNCAQIVSPINYVDSDREKIIFNPASAVLEFHIQIKIEFQNSGQGGNRLSKVGMCTILVYIPMLQGKSSMFLFF